jgi:hypothetical protein
MCLEWPRSAQERKKRGRKKRSPIARSSSRMRGRRRLTAASPNSVLLADAGTHAQGQRSISKFRHPRGCGTHTPRRRSTPNSVVLADAGTHTQGQHSISKFRRPRGCGDPYTGSTQHQQIPSSSRMRGPIRRVTAAHQIPSSSRMRGPIHRVTAAHQIPSSSRMREPIHRVNAASANSVILADAGTHASDGCPPPRA